MARLVFVTTVLAVFVALYTLTSASPSPAEREKGDALGQVKSLVEEVRRLNVKVGELEKQVSALRTASERAPLFVRASEQTLLPEGIELPTAIQPPPARDSLPGSYDTCQYVFPAYQEHDLLRARIELHPLIEQSQVYDSLSWNDDNDRYVFRSDTMSNLLGWNYDYVLPRWTDNFSCFSSFTR